MTANYGDRARIGMLLPSVNRAAEPQITEMMPDGVSLHTTRLRLQSSMEEHINEMVADVERGAVMLADADVDLIVFHCTAASMFAPGFDDGIIERIEIATGKPATLGRAGETAAEGQCIAPCVRESECRHGVALRAYPIVSVWVSQFW